jgi:RNA polymerase sigma-70 factor (ECF subfamily)
MDNWRPDVSRLIAEARRAKAGSLDQLLGAFRNYLKLLAQTSLRAALRSKADPSDVAQETMLRAARHFDQFRGVTEAELASWLRQILARYLANLARHYQVAGARRIDRECSLENLLAASSAALGQLSVGSEGSPSRVAQRRELSVILADALAELPVDYREVIVLHNLEELDWSEVGQRMDRTPAAARMLWARALKQLRPLLEERT